MDLKSRKKIFSVMSGLAIGASSLSHKYYNEKSKNEPKEYFIVNLIGNRLTVYETDDIYNNVDDYHFFASDGNNYDDNVKDSFITESREEAEDFYSRFCEKENIIATWVGKRKKKRM